MARSMTAFTRLSGSGKEEGWGVEIRSLNHRYFEFSFKGAPFLYPLEPRIRDRVQERLRRGKVSVAMISPGQEDAEKAVALDEKAVSFYLKAAEHLKRKFGLKDELTLRDVLALPRIFTAERGANDPEKTWDFLEKLLDRALKSALRMREAEGRKLTADIQGRLEKIGKAARRVEKLATGSSKKYFKALNEKLEKLLGDRELDQERLHREVALMAERIDVTEELVRLGSHLELFGNRLQTSEEVGRELDFLCQEINREVNTLGSKSQSFEISTEVIFMKKELEKVREQVQNIE